MNNVLIVSGHTDLDNSFANKIILDNLDYSLPDAKQIHLDKLYPNYIFDIHKEQERLMNADIIVLQFPFFWYGVPSLMKKWIEDVFSHGFSHGSTGDKVKGKKLLLSFTSGAPESMYQYGGIQSYPIEDFLPPLKQFANLCRMEWAGHVYTGGLSYIAKSEEQRVDMRARALAHAEKLIEK
ncbi:NAD(P)H-dependent oxidoreductase [Pectobacterium brasiliense]|nr:NAD(P)H-dependent oxidoreductase [Pectobacterium brasiliense]MBA0196120.1 NAD(P)H-dependent oxidoreductase [Pectobacterium brasiliense]MBN3093736.1 NAD(P)H-dependent oxidoreductase [Pectobacterium brasiliense]MBN3140284.1 NAD(P)H-dependent oxidoreductase [Pectobacterium brasiliense]MBW5896881.1 NAD(P)H-dependent oxidoreductase [Pectobacterium brasiliense]